MASEAKSRDIVKEWVGTGVRCEEVPASVMKSKKLVIELRPWCYLYNLVGYVLKYLDDLKANKLLCDHPFIPSDEIHLKIGGDHGGGSFKASFQVGNVLHPNQSSNTVIWSIMEAKDYRSNLLLCLERFEAHIDQFGKICWQGKKIRMFVFGDYEFLCAIYGLSGASGRHCCLWCEIPQDMLKVKPSAREEIYASRTLESLYENLHVFKTRYGGNLKHAMNCKNVIATRFFNVPYHKCVYQVYISH